MILVTAAERNGESQCFSAGLMLRLLSTIAFVGRFVNITWAQEVGKKWTNRAKTSLQMLACCCPQ